MKIQDKTQDMQEPQEKHQDKYKKRGAKKILDIWIKNKSIYG